MPMTSCWSYYYFDSTIAETLGPTSELMSLLLPFLLFPHVYYLSSWRRHPALDKHVRVWHQTCLDDHHVGRADEAPDADGGGW